MTQQNMFPPQTKPKLSPKTVEAALYLLNAAKVNARATVSVLWHEDGLYTSPSHDLTEALYEVETSLETVIARIKERAF